MTISLHVTPAATPLELRLTFRAGANTGNTDTGDANTDNDRTTVTVRSPDLDIDVPPRPFTDPLASDASALADLRWYLEDYSSWPVGPYVERARRVERGLTDIGRRLFQAVFRDPKARAIWQQFRSARGAPKLLTIDARDPEILGLPWELLAHERSHLFALDISIRRRVHETGQALTGPAFDLPLRILMVTARPDDLGFIDPRLSPRALLDAVAVLGEEAVAVEFLPTPTFAALSRRLRDARLPPVHVIHFDGHGQYDASRDMGQNMGYLAFEDQRGHTDPVDADKLGQLMANARTPLLLLDACQSASVEGPAFSSVAPRLVEAGVGAVVAMPYSVYPKTSERFFRGFYRGLVAGETIGRAVDQGRWDLFDNPKRDEIYYPPEKDMVALELRDWFLPVLYQRARDLAPWGHLPARHLPGPMDSSITDCHYLEPRFSANLLGGFPEPKYCFVGRARELWQLQRQLTGAQVGRLAPRRVVVVQGLAGQGKTALASEAARWLLRTGHFKKAVFVSFQGGGDRDRALGQLGDALMGDGFAKLGRDERLPALLAELAKEPVLIVWDNFESVLPGWEAALPADELAALLETGLALVGENAGSAALQGGINNQGANRNIPRSQARLLITTRDAGLAQHHTGFAPSPWVAELPLKGMATYEALELAGAVLDARSLPRPPREGLEELLGYLGGHPLSVLLVTPHLADYQNDVKEVIRRFEAIYPGFTQGRARERNESLEVSLGFSLDRVSPTARDRMPVLGAFAQGALDLALSKVSDPETWARDGQGLLAELEQAGLVTAESLPVSRGALRFLAGDNEPPREAFAQKAGVTFYRFHPTLAPYLRGRWGDEQRRTYQERHRRFYYALANNLYLLDSRDPHSARALARRALPNLRRALDGMLASADPNAIDFADSVERFLNIFGRWRERDALLAAVRERFQGLPDISEGPLTKTAYLAISGRGQQLLDQGRPHQAGPLFLGLLARMEGAGYDTGFDRTVVLVDLGRSLRDQGRAEAAAEVYREALAALGGLDQTDRAVRRQTGATHTDLADVLTDVGQYDGARVEYERGLAIKEELGDSREVAVSNGQLGTLALRQGDYGEARRRYRTALEEFQRMGEQQSVAGSYHQLAMVAEKESKGASGADKQKRLQEAEENYRQALRGFESFGDHTNAAQSANQLAIVAQYGGRMGDAERWVLRAIELDSRSGNRKQLAGYYNNLADLLENVHRLDAEGASPGQRPAQFAGRDLLTEAEQWAHKAVEIYEDIGDPSLPIWSTYTVLANIADARARESEAAGDADGAARHRQAARQWRTKAQAAFERFGR